MKTDSKILAADFEYLHCKTQVEALDYLAEQGGSAKILAGGTDLLVKMKTGALQCDRLISIQQIASLNYLQDSAASLKIGAVTTLREVEANPQVKLHYSALFEALRSMAATSVRNMGTIGGNLCNGSPAADTAPPLLVFDAAVTLTSKQSQRTLPIAEFFLGPGKTALAVGELMTEIELPMPAAYSGSSFLKLGRVAADIAKINVAVYVERDGAICRDCRIAFGAVAPTPLRLLAAESMLRGKRVTAELFKEVGQSAAELIQPITDKRSSSSYRTKVSPILLEEALIAAWRRSGGEV